MKRKFKAGLTSVSLPVFIADTSSTTGGGLSGVTSASSGLVLEYRRHGSSSWTNVTAVSKTLGTYTSGGIVADGSLAGAYEVDFPDAAFAAGVRFVACRIRGVTNMLPVLIEVELDAVDYQDAAGFGLSRIDAATSSRMASYTQPTGFLGATFPTTVASTTNITSASGVTLAATTHTGAVIPTVTSVTNGVTVSDKTGFSLASNGLSSVTSWTVAITGNITGNLSGSVGSISGVTFPTNFASLGINPSGHISRVVLVDTTTTNTDMRGTDGAALASAWTATRAGYLDTVLLSGSANRTVKVTGTGAGHVAADIHELQTAVIQASHFASGAIDANALAADAASEIATAVAATQALSRLDSMIESDGAGQFRFDTIALSMAPSGGGGGSTDWTANERTAIRSILGIPTSGTTPEDPTSGILDEIRDDIGMIGINVYPVSASTPERVNGTTITVYKDEQTNVTISTTATLTGLTLRFVAENRAGQDVLVVENAGFAARTATSATLQIPSTLTDEIAVYNWTLRDVTTGNSVLARGVLSVQAAASKDA